MVVSTGNKSELAVSLQGERCDSVLSLPDDAEIGMALGGRSIFLEL